MPAFSAGTVNCPSALVTASDVAAVAMFFTMTLAPGMTAPDVSVTVPESDDVAPPWAKAAGAPMATTATARKAETNSLRSTTRHELLLACERPEMRSYGNVEGACRTGT